MSIVIRSGLSFELPPYVHNNLILWADSEYGLNGNIIKNLVDSTKYDLTINGNLPYSNKGLTFNGNVNNYITVPAFDELANTNEFTCEMAIYATNINTTQRILFIYNFFEFFIRYNKAWTDMHFDGLPREQFTGDINRGFNTFTSVYKANEYNKFYVNGIQVASKTAVNPDSTPTIGSIGQGQNKYPAANGTKFYTMRVYNRALSSDEILINRNIDVKRFAGSVK